MNIKTYFNKTNTIISNSTNNTSQNPVSELYYGNAYTRLLLYIDVSRISGMTQDYNFPEQDKLKHILKMKNCWGLQTLDSKQVFNSGKDTIKERTSGFTLYLYRVPEPWGEGVGNDFTKDGFLTKNYSVSENGSNWFNSGTNIKWVNGDGAISGLTTGDCIASQYFEIGNEDLEMDITTEINSIISGATNNGFIICFDPDFEKLITDVTQYVGFFTNKTSTFFKPYLETIYNNPIIDDRGEFYLDKNNSLYFYSIIGGQLTNLDQFPNCSINGSSKVVKQAAKGVYYVDNILIPSHGVGLVYPDTMIYDIWSDIIYNGISFPDIELEFVTKTNSDYFNFGNSNNEQLNYIPTIYGIKYGEKITRGDIKKIFVSPRVEYTTNVVNNITGMEYRLYVKETNKEITVIDYQPVNRAFNSNYFLIDTNSLLPNTYYLDVRISRNDEVLIHKSKLMFEINNEL